MTNALKVSIVAGALAVVGLLGTAAPAAASDCSLGGNGDLDPSPACQVAAKVVCGIVLKGNPCLD